jgi:uncharacterized protein YnzC (UPF0291/DUF896 family)
VKHFAGAISGDHPNRRGCQPILRVSRPRGRRPATPAEDPVSGNHLPLALSLEPCLGMALHKAMATHTDSSISDAAILAELTWPDDDALSPAAAKGWLAVRFDKEQLRRMHELATKNQDGKLTAKEKREMENYRRVSFLLDLMHSKARRSLKKQRPVH